jgi:hypothetical protein
MDVVVIGIDLGKNSCSVAGLDIGGNVVFRRHVSRFGLVEIVRKTSRLRRRDGSLLRRASSWAGLR